MSGIFGFSFKQLKTANNLLHALDLWNRSYGSEASDMFNTEHFGIGCHIEHLSDEIPFGKPIQHTDDTTAVIDAVLYNRDELSKTLDIQDISQISDEELLLLLIKQKGFPALAQVNGDFAGAIYDKKAKTWTLFRDHMGVRPLYYYADNDLFAFSTDMRGIIAIPGVDININEEKLYLRMMGYNDLTLCRTDFDNINCIRPASWTVVKENDTGFSFDENIYWKIRQKKIRLKKDEDYHAELRRLITDSVKRRLDAVSGLIGGELSGGLDSGVIDILISRLGREGRYFSWSRPPEEIPLQEGDDERKIILDICKQENITCKFSPTSMGTTLEEQFSLLTPPYVNTQNLSDGSAYLKSQGARVVFTGHGGDEGVSHRCNPFELWYHKEYFSFFKLFWYNTKGKKLRLLRAIKRSLRQIFRDNPQFLIPYENVTLNCRKFLKDSFKERMSKKTTRLPLQFAYAPEEYIEQGGPRMRLDNVAYHGARNGVRYMIPFLDYRVIDFAVSIPRRLYLNGKVNRYIYRQAFRDIIPESLYKMQYKDTASQRNLPLEDHLRDNFMKSVKTVVSHLDREFWKEYLNFDEIDNFNLVENYTKNDFFIASFTLHDLTMCAFIQNVKDNAGKWCEEHE